MEVGIPGSCTTLIAAMSFASSEMVQVLLRNGANLHETEISGNNAFMCACAFNRLDNVKVWLKHVQTKNFDRKFDINTRNKSVGATALHLAVFMGSDRYDLVKYLIKKGSNLNLISHTGGSVLMSLVESEDCDPHVARLFLSQLSCKDVNYRRRSRTVKWFLIRTISKLATRLNLTNPKTSMIRLMAEGAGASALHFAAKRGDIEILELLLGSGAEPSSRNDLGQSVLSICESRYPELYGILMKRERKTQMRSRGTQHRSKHEELLGKRFSTATPIQHDMWLISLENLLSLYGQLGHTRVMEVHQNLRQRNFLIRWQDVSSDAEIIFVSHEWLSWAHPDPKGEQLGVLCKVLERLKSGEIDRVDGDCTDSS